MTELFGRAVMALTHEKCDRCHVADAVVKVKTKAGDLHLCGHHFRKHRAHVMERAYVTEQVGE